MGSVVLLPGIITGLGRNADCEVLAWKAADRPADAFSQFKIVTAPRHLPDGSYTVTFNGQAFSTTKEQGWWTMEKLA